MITAKQAKRITDDSILNYQDSIDDGIFDNIKAAAAAGKSQISVARQPTRAELDKLTELGYYYEFDCCEWGESHTIGWSERPPSQYSKIINKLKVSIRPAQRDR